MELNRKLLTIVFITLNILCITTAVRQNPLKDPKICGRPQCELDTEKFGFNKTTRYKYEYNVHIRSEFTGSGENTSDLYFTSNVDFVFPRKCEGVISLSGVQLRLKLTDENGNETKDSESESSKSSSPSEYEYFNAYDEIPDEDEEVVVEEVEEKLAPGLHPKTRDLARALEKNDLRFSFHDGLISEVCPDTSEPSWVLNFKKGILSSLQNTMLRFDIDYNTRETDISGECDVEYTLESTDDIFIVIKKEKNIASCRSRHKTHSILQSTPYTFRDDKAIWPILNSQSYCNFTIDHNVYKDIDCFEKHQLVPFSNNYTGALTETHSKLTLVKEEVYKTEDFLAYENGNSIQRRSTLLFDHTPPKKPTHTEIEHSKQLLKKMCQYGFPNIQREFIDIFTTFLKTVKFLEYKTLTELLVSADSICKHGRDHLLESLPYIQSTASYQVMRDQITNERIPKHMANSWMTLLSFVRNPDEETIDTFYTILEYAQSKLDTEYTLGASAVVHNFCKHNANCETHPKIDKIIVFLEKEFLKHLKTFKNDRRIRDRLIVILKALGNIGFVHEDFENKLKDIISTESYYLTELRLYSVLAFRRADCLKYRPFFMDIYSNMSMNSEIRIYSYIQSMRCPDYQSVSYIMKVLKNEKVNQVGSYVWSHLKNIAKSSSPVRIETQGLLISEDLDDKFKMDMRKFSRNYEHSLFFDEYNFGTATDANLIFGSDSYIPRLMTFNFTADLFGESVNFFEISSRAEGFEQLITSIFGPTGPLNRELFRKKFAFLNKFFGEDGLEEANESLDNMLNFDNLRFKRSSSNSEDYVFESEDINSSTRSKRSASQNKQKEIYDKIDKLGYKLDYDHDNPRATIAVRIFGNDLRYYSLEGMMEIMGAAKEFDPFFQLGKFLSGEELVFTKNNVFLDASYDVPLSVGLPLSIHALGASSTDLRMSGNFKKYDHPKEWHFDIKAKVKPSISVDVITTMQSDFFYALSGIRVKSNLYSSSSVETKIKVRGHKQVGITFDLPQDKNEIFSARSELIVMQDQEEISQHGIEYRQTNRTCTWPVIGESIGLQMCSQFSVPDLSKLNNSVVHPGLLLSGPINISMVLEKSDLSAKTFAFEYKWQQQKDDSQVSVIFHTPGSSIERRLTANFTRSLDLYNASLVFKNGNNKFLADGEYYKNPENRRLKFNLESNGVKNLQFEAQMNRTKDGTSYLYTPIFRLDVNGEGVTGMKGTIRVYEKLGICQNDIALVFETKKLQILVKGNFVQSETTTSTNMTVHYRFHAKNYETINFGAKLFSLGEKFKTEYKADMKLNTTAYPKMNFVSQGSWLSLQGHVEGKFTHNNAPDLQDPKYTSTVKVMFARQTDDIDRDESRTRAAIGLTIPRSKVYFRLSLKHEQQNKNGTVHNVLTGLRYSEDKEATGAFSFHFPRRNFFAMNGYVNLTVPDFNSSTAIIKVFEKSQKDYFVDFNGTWFTGHTAAIKANYKDKSSRVQIYHHLKLTADSPSFESTSVNAVYRRTQVRIFGDLQAMYSKDPYGLTYELYKDPEEHKANGKLKLNVRGRQYWILGNLSNLQEKLMEVEIHLDKVRDIFMKVTGLSEDKKKRITAEVKWDANRDPTQSITAYAQYNNPFHKLYEGELIFTYPDKVFKCSFNTFTGGPTYNGSMIAMWSVNDIIRFTYDAGFLPGNNFNNWINADLDTPFEGWRRNKLSSGIYTKDNLILVNSTIIWADNQLLSVMYNSDYLMEDPKIKFEVCLGVNSTIQDIPTLSAKIKHDQDINIFNSEIDLKYYNGSLFHYGIKSDWLYDPSGGYKNVTGKVLMFTPFEGYEKGGLATKFSLSDSKTITGAASLNFDKKEFTLVLEGYAKKFTNNMLQINITTPLEKFKTIKGRFGLNEKKRHAVAVVESPNSALGAEILLDIVSFSDFDVKLILATPLDVLRLASVIGKYNDYTVDMRGTLNNATMGFTGVWRMNNMTDFEYSYKVFTPFKDFEDNGVVLKLIKQDIFICEIHGKLSKHKLGVKINGEPKSRLIKQLSSQKLDLELLYDEDLQKPVFEDDEDYEEDESLMDTYFTYYVDFEVDTLMLPTITGFGDVQEIREYFIILGDVRLPQGDVEIKDRVYFPDYMHIKNVLNMNTPFPQCKDIKSIFEYDLDLKTRFMTDFNVIVKDAAKTVTEVGYFVNYTTTNREPDDKVHNAVVTLKTPFELLKQIDIYASMQLEENTYKGNLTSVTENTYLELSGSLETDDNFIESSLGIALDTNVVPFYGCNLYFKKDFTNIDNKIVVQFEITDDNTTNKLHLETNWNLDPNYHIHAKGKLNTNILPLRTTETALLVTKGPNPQIIFDLNLTNKNNQIITYGARANKLKDEVNIQIWTPMRNYRNISMTGNLKKQTTTNGIDQYQLSGKLYRNLVVYSVNGIVYLKSAFPVKVNLRLKPNNNGPDGVIELSVKETDDKTGNSLEFSAIEDGKMCSINAGYSMRNHYDWDMSVLVQSSEEAISRINLNAKLKPVKQGKFISSLDLETPWRELGVEKIHLGSTVEVTKDSGVMTGDFDLGTISGHGSSAWTWVIYQNMKLDLESQTQRLGFEPRIVKTTARYENPGKSWKQMKAGGSIDLDNVWSLGVNGTINYNSENDILGNVVAKLPKPIGDVHRIMIKYLGNVLKTDEPINIFVEGKYDAEESLRKFNAKGSYRNVEDMQGLGNVRWGIGDKLEEAGANFHMLRKNEARKEFTARLRIPYYKDEDAFTLGGFYDVEAPYSHLVCKINSPQSRQLADTDIKFANLENLEGFLNCTTPFLNVSWVKADFNFSTQNGETIRYVKGEWPKDSAYFDLKNKYTSEKLNKDFQGTIKMELPLQSKHTADISYGLKERQLLNTGYANVIYNEKQILKGQYNCKSEEKAGYEKDVVDISLENEMKPLGVRYVHLKQFSRPDFVDFDMKHTQIYELHNATNFNLTGEFHIRTTETGQDFKIVAIHSNRTVIINSEFDIQDTKKRHNSKIQVAPEAWIGYNLILGNDTTQDNEKQNFAIELFYPKRNLSADGYYSMTHEKFDSDISFGWTMSPDPDEDKKYIRTGLVWQSEPLQPNEKDSQSVLLTISHPMLEKDATLRASFSRGVVDFIRTNITIDYSNDPRHLVVFNAKVSDLSTIVGHTNYTLDVYGLHEASNIEVNIQGNSAARTSFYKTLLNSYYKRGYYPEKEGLFLAKIDLINKEIEYERTSENREIRLWAMPYGSFPFYGLNATIWDTPDFNHTGYFYIDLDRKVTRMEINLTEDASQNLQMVGYIPDARSGYFDIWRNYDEIRIIDVASYLRMNHSRLITGQFHWRPKLKADLKDKIKSVGRSFYSSVSDGIDFWVKSGYSEMVESVNEVWDTAKTECESFIDDVRDLAILEEDIAELRQFLNSSYEANDFYIKTVVNFTVSILDELALKNHIQSLPKIFSELWQAMGESGKALKNSVRWLIKTVQTTYDKILEAISRFFHGDSLSYISSIMEVGLDKYDKFMKDLHLTSIKYVEKIWNNFWNMASNYWKSVLKRIEPHLYKFAHYLEGAIWNVSQEVFDFINNRTSELVDSPYFNKVTSLTQDLDKLIKDIQANDAITNIKKYSVIAWNFVREKYFKLVPFGKELNDILMEILEEIKSLEKLPHVKIVIEKAKEIQAKLEWLAEELQVEKRLHEVWAVLRNKVRRYTWNALETDDLYREAKTKFIFDPETGIIDLQQKLPMSWHAFNETPKFEEIPEYKLLSRVQEFFGKSNITILNHIYGMRLYMDPKSWLPPYSSHALLIGSRHYMTFDKKFVGINTLDTLNGNLNTGKCTYLLVHDYFKKNFTLLLEPSVIHKNGKEILTKKLTMLTSDGIIEINVSDDKIKIGDNDSPILPMRYGNLTIFRDTDVVSIESDREFMVHCNIQFDLCWFEVAGWYFGQTAGILGTMNNEPFDDMIASNKVIQTKEEEFVNSWALDQCKGASKKVLSRPTPEIVNLCNQFFKSPHFTPCTHVINPTPFIDMCLDMGMNSIATILKENHPAQKGACTAALGYIEACASAKIPLRIPDQCVHCDLPNGTYVPEGTFLTLRDQNILDSTDIVFLIEAKPCNKDLFSTKSFQTLLESINDELSSIKMEKNRFSVMTFGGRVPFDKPRSIVYKNEVFTYDIRDLKQQIEHIEFMNGSNNDAFQALMAASKLIFRPGASKTIIMLPCTTCLSREMMYDYTSMLQLLNESGINLHILTDVEFEFEKTKKVRQFFAMDKNLVYTKKNIEGDYSLKNHTKTTTKMGLCVPLALETNGAVFSSRRLETDKKNPVKKAAALFAKRIAKTAKPSSCQNCECTGHNTGVAYMACEPCDDFDDNDDYNMMDSDFDEWDFNEEDE